ncbi:MAG: GIY-YIG nuclease family protein [bacterium]|nr:GIY-YIG nuclease family protein [bacterium]
MFLTYVIYNKSRDKIYIGQTADIAKRLERHNGLKPSKSKSYTKKNSGTWELIHEENFQNRKEAIVREKQLKTAKGREFIKSLIPR